MLKKFNYRLFQAQRVLRAPEECVRQRMEKDLLQVLHRNMRRKEGGDILSVADQVTHNGRADERVLRLREEEDRVDTRQTTVGVGDGLLRLPVLPGRIWPIW